MDPAVKDADMPLIGRTIKVGAFDLPIPTWCIPVFGLIAVLYVGYALLGAPIQTVYTRYSLGGSEEQDQEESYKHFSEQPALEVHNAGPGGTLEAKLFSDGCVSVTWQASLSKSPPRVHFIKRVTAEEVGTAPGRVSRVERGIGTSSAALFASVFPVSGADTQAVLADLVRKTAGAAGPSTPSEYRPVAAGSCLDPHPGSYSTAYGSRNGCWVQVWRRFPDGCEHYQWFNSCANVWDVNPNGSPHVYWTQCRH